MIDRIRELELEVLRQWETNHAEHCGKRLSHWPHAGRCNWPLPPALAAMAPNEVLKLLQSLWVECD